MLLNHYSLDAIENPRLQQLKKLSAYLFTAIWCASKQLCIPDALPHSPVSHPTPEEEALSTETNVSIRTVVTLRTIQSFVNPQRSEFSPDNDKAMEVLWTAA